MPVHPRRFTRAFDSLCFIATSLKLNVSFSMDNESHFYGSTIHLPICSNTIFIWKERDNRILFRELAHELGHYLVTPKSRRHKKNYGIPKKSYTLRNNWKRWNLEEYKASVLENELLKLVGAPITTYKDPLKNSGNLDRLEELDLKNAVKLWFNTSGKVIVQRCQKMIKK